MYSSKAKIVFIFFIINSCQHLIALKNNNPTPVVLWHGMGDSCCFSFSLGAIKNIIEEEIPGIYVKSVKIGNNVIEDVENSYFKNVNEQIEEVCEDLANDPSLKDGYNAIGFSQGGQFLRGLAERCPIPQMKNLISLGGQHQGVYGLPNCGSLEHKACDYLRRMLNHGAYLSFIQNRFVQAEYWHDPLQEDEYRKNSVFLADINNELVVNEPRESEWFGFYKPGQSVELQTLQDSDLYIEDRLGLQQMDQAGKIHFLSIPTNHLQFDEDWLKKQIIHKYLV
ncbi:Similar to PPT1: Palmitoyl-protein thioesterase 1 (Macaca fascicularis) [Cotesia congregata]|uniref:Palmitoyl-protein thioesterase 1 n=1 Tax=Cotesia congregata TaxID=51543 RepID=A0A8J2HKD8_COTCN|nr:Similar to PPT1: Palmitoyl-protein thioesterase 1 (Macaca fascicularis) [Cotesia congregata]